MKLYQIHTKYCSLQKNFVVAESYAHAEELWMEKHTVEPSKITYITPNIIFPNK